MKRLLGRLMCRIQKDHWYMGIPNGVACVRCGWYDVDVDQ